MALSQSRTRRGSVLKMMTSLGTRGTRGHRHENAKIHGVHHMVRPDVGVALVKLEIVDLVMNLRVLAMQGWTLTLDDLPCQPSTALALCRNERPFVHVLNQGRYLALASETGSIVPGAPVSPLECPTGEHRLDSDKSPWRHKNPGTG